MIGGKAGDRNGAFCSQNGYEKNSMVLVLDCECGGIV